MTEMTLGQWPTDMCHNCQISNTRDSFTWATINADSTNSGRDFLSLSSFEDTGMGLSITSASDFDHIDPT